MLVLVTNRKLCGPRALSDVIAEALEGGADWVILREKDLPAAELSALAEKIKGAMPASSRLIIHSNLQVAQGPLSDGVHMTFGDFLALEKADVARITESGKALGVSIHSVDEAVRASDGGATYLLAGHIFETACKAGVPGRGLEFLTSVCERVSVPVIALGGITPDNGSLAYRHGAAGIAVMSGVMSADSPKSAALAYKCANCKDG